MRVLFTTTAGRGHVNPMLPLAGALQARGHEVEWACYQGRCDLLAEEGFLAHPSGVAEIDPTWALSRAPDVLALPPEERPNLLFARIFGPDRVEPMLADLLPIVERRAPDLLICDAAELAGPIAAAVASVPHATHGFGALLPARRVAPAADALAPLWRRHGVEPAPFAGMGEHIYIDIYPESLHDAEWQRLGAVQQVRPVADRPPATSGDDRLIYVTFGTVFNQELAPFAAAVEGACGLPMEVLVTVGGNLPPEALGEQPPNVRLAAYVPQAEILPRCAAVVSHAGSGTFLAALAHGIPQLLLPMAADQFLNAAAVARSGVGLVIAPGEVSAATVRSALERLLTEQGFRGAARRAAREIAGMPSPDDAAAALEQRFL